MLPDLLTRGLEIGGMCPDPTMCPRVLLTTTHTMRSDVAAGNHWHYGMHARYTMHHHLSYACAMHARCVWQWYWLCYQ